MRSVSGVCVVEKGSLAPAPKKVHGALFAVTSASSSLSSEPATEEDAGKPTASDGPSSSNLRGEELGLSVENEFTREGPVCPAADVVSTGWKAKCFHDFVL